MYSTDHNTVENTAWKQETQEIILVNIKRFETQSNFLRLSFQTEYLFCHFALNLNLKACEKDKAKTRQVKIFKKSRYPILNSMFCGPAINWNGRMDSMFSVIAHRLNFHLKQVCNSDELCVSFPVSSRVPDFRREPLLLFFSPERSLRVFPHFFFLQVLFQLTHWQSGDTELIVFPQPSHVAQNCTE